MKIPDLLALLVLFAALLPAQLAGAGFSQQGPKLFGASTVADVGQGRSVALSADGNTAIVGGSLNNGDAGAVWIWTRNAGTWMQQGKLVGSGALGSAGQGDAVSLSADGNTALVGGPGDGNNAGATWVWTRNGGVWTQQAKLVGSGALGAASQGVAVSLSADGNTAIIGGSVDNNDAGAAWVWTRSGTTWTQQGGKLVGALAIGNAFQGRSVSLSGDGNTAIVGGSGDNGFAGAVWVWTRNGGIWSQQGDKLVGAGASGNARQGNSICLSSDGNTAIVGGPADNNGGAAWVWTRLGGVWLQQGNKLSIVPSGATQGWSVSLSGDGNTAIIGGPTDDEQLTAGPCLGCGTGFVGAAWIWVRNGGLWSQQGKKLVGSEGSVTGPLGQGFAVALSSDGHTAIVGGPYDGGSRGAAWLYVSPDGAQRRRAIMH